jgi:hypothetical protein
MVDFLEGGILTRKLESYENFFGAMHFTEYTPMALSKKFLRALITQKKIMSFSDGLVTFDYLIRTEVKCS